MNGLTGQRTSVGSHTMIPFRAFGVQSNVVSRKAAKMRLKTEMRFAAVSRKRRAPRSIQ